MWISNSPIYAQFVHVEGFLKVFGNTAWFTAVPTSWAIFENNQATFYPNIWSHSSQTLYTTHTVNHVYP